MGLLDLPAPILSRLDDWLGGFLPPLARLVLWAALAALVSMEVYRLLSPQRRITQLKRALDDARRRVAGFDGELDEAWPHLRAMLSLALRRVGVVLPATILASLPLLAFIVWMDGAYGGAFPPPGEPVAVQVPGSFEGRFVEDGSGPPRAEVVDAAGRLVADQPMAAPVPVLHKRQWWNVLIGNPAGYLPDDAPVDRIDIGLPRREILPVGPGWLRGWEATFFAALTGFALLFKTVRRIA